MPPHKGRPTPSALLAEKLAAKLGRRRALIGIYLLLTVLGLALAAARTSALIVALLLAYSFVSAANWPMLESLVSSGADPHAISRRISIYNLVWSFANAGIIAGSGVIIAWSRAGIFLVAAGATFLCVVVMVLRPAIDPGDVATPPHAEPEPELLASRRLAMWLARIALPATFVIVYSLMAMMPSLPVIRVLSTAQRTLVGSVWMAARTVAFAVLGLTVWWHTRPRLLLASAAIMLIAFCGVTIPLSDLLPVASPGADLASMVSWQLVLGCAMGIIYAGSLYFGMVLSEGSTEHGGYHEALIGLGSILGPGAGALTQAFASAPAATGETPWARLPPLPA